MSEIGELKRMLADHMDSSNENHLKVMVALTELKTRESVNHNRIKKLEAQSSNTEAIKNQGKGMALLTKIIWAVTGSGVTALIAIYFKTH